jgi:hypothetical protein
MRVTYPDEVVALVSHADVIKAIIAHYVGMHLDLFQRLVIAPASLTWLHLGRGGPRLVVMNDTGAVPRPPEKKAAEAPAMGGVEATTAGEPATETASEAPAAGVDGAMAAGATTDGGRE